MTDEIARLREQRGHEQVLFSQIADHLRDYVERNAVDAAVVQRLAGFLADVEHIDHDHDADPHHSLG